MPSTLHDPPAPVAAARGESPTGRLLVALVVLWPVAATLPPALQLPPALAVPAVALVGAAYARWALFASRPERRRTRRALLRAHPIRAGRALVAAASVALAVAAGCAQLATARWIGDAAAPSAAPYLDRGPMAVAAVLLAGVVVTPVMEELAFRGAIATLVARRHGEWVAIAVSAAVFAAAHLRPALVPLLVTGGLALGALGWAARSVWAPVAAHALWNVCAFAARDALGADRAPTTSTGSMLLAATFAAASGAFWFLVRRLRSATASPHAAR